MDARVVIILDEQAQIGPVEEAIIRLTAEGNQSVHIISTDGSHDAFTMEATPRRLRLLLLMARLADRLVPVTGEVANRTDVAELRRQIAMAQADRVYVADSANRWERLLRRDTCSRLRRLGDLDVHLLPAMARVPA